MLTLSWYKLVRSPETCVYVRTLAHEAQNYAATGINLMGRHESAGVS